MMRTIAAGALLLLAAVAVAAAPPLEQVPPPRMIPMAGLVKQLGSEDFHEREAATRRLSALAIDPPPELLAATRSESPEVRIRAIHAIQSMRGNVAIARMPRGERFAREGKVDLFVAATAAWNLKPEDRRLWEPAFDLGRRMIAKAEMTGERKPHGCLCAYYKDYQSLVDRLGPKYTRVDNEYIRKEPESYEGECLGNEVIQAPGVTVSKGIVNTLIISRGSVTVANRIEQSVVLANGDISLANGDNSAPTILRNSVLVCDGDVTLTGGHFMGCVVVARGNITAAEGAIMSVLMAGGKVTLGKERVIEPKRYNYNVVVEGEPNSPLAFLQRHPNTLGLTFFELYGTLGLSVKAEGGEVTVTNYKLRGAAAAAGVEIGDVITGVNGKKPDSAESLRRLLRDALAIGDATVTLKRGDKTVTVKVSLPE